jgi:hypothetical protein
MKFTKMSLVAALLVGSSAFAVDNIKVSGDAQLVYSTSNDVTTGYSGVTATNDAALFDKDSSAADAALHLGITADLAKNDLVTVSTGAKMTVLTTLGLENNFVSNVWGSAHTATAGTNASYGNALGGAKVENANWFNEAYVAVASGKSILKVGRQELDTPLAFTEKWTIEQNTFEAAVLINQDIPDTTVVAAFVGNGNGTETFGQQGATQHSNVAQLGLAAGGVVNGNGEFTTYGSDGAYALAVINNSFKPLTVQAWYYDVTNIAQAYWLQADLDATDLGVAGLFAGVQYSGLSIDSTQDKILGNGAATAVKADSSATALMLGYKMKDVVCVKGSYSMIGDEHSAGQNTATDFVGGTAQSKLYTEAWWNYGFVTQADTTAMNLTITSPVQGMFDLGVYYTSVDQSTAKGDNDLTEVTLTAGKTLGPVDATLAYIYADAKQAKDTVTIVQAYITVNF